MTQPCTKDILVLGISPVSIRISKCLFLLKSVQGMKMYLHQSHTGAPLLLCIMGIELQPSMVVREVSKPTCSKQMDGPYGCNARSLIQLFGFFYAPESSVMLYHKYHNTIPRRSMVPLPPKVFCVVMICGRCHRASDGAKIHVT